MTQEEASTQEQARLYYTLRQNDGLQNLIETVDDFTYEMNDLYDDEIREKESKYIVFLRIEDEGETNYIARGILSQEEDDIIVEDVYVEKSTVVGPLAGHGLRWMYEDGEIVEREWVA